MTSRVRRRRAVLALLVVVSLILLTAYFGESPSSPLHTVQRGIVEVLSPIQEGASKALKPVRDVAGWFSLTLHAKSQRDELRKESRHAARRARAAQQQAIRTTSSPSRSGSTTAIGIEHYQPVAANVIGRDPTLWYATVEVDKGSADGVHKERPGDRRRGARRQGHDGRPERLDRHADHRPHVRGRGGGPGPAGDTGVLVPAVGNPNQLLLQYLPPHAPDLTRASRS